MKRTIVSGFSGDDWKDLVAVTWPAMEAYSQSHGCEFRGVQLRDFGRPVSWSKLFAMADALATSDEVLWIDADVAIVDMTRSLFDDFADGHQYAICRVVDERDQPHFNCGVWAVRRSAFPFLVAVAMQDHAIVHPWWEQKAVNCLAEEFQPCVLPNEWNWWPGDKTTQSPRFRHACVRGVASKLALVREWLCK